MDFLKWLFTSAVITMSGIFGIPQTAPATLVVPEEPVSAIEQDISNPNTTVGAGELMVNKATETKTGPALLVGTEGIAPRSGNMPLTVKVAVKYTPACPPRYSESTDDVPWWFWQEQFKIEYGDGQSETVYISSQPDQVVTSNTLKNCGIATTALTTHTYQKFGVFNVSLKRVLDGEEIVGNQDSPPKENVVKTIGIVTVTVQGSPSLAIVAPSNVQKGAPIKIEWSGKNLPGDSSVGFFIEPDVPDGERWKQTGPSGALSLKAINPDGKASGNFAWDGQSFGCAPTDFPTICKGALEPGKYVLTANVYNKKDASLVLGWGANYKSPLVIAKAETRFTVGGSYNLEPLKQKLQSVALKKMQDTMKAYAFAGTQMERYMRMRGDLSGPDTSGNYCAMFDALPPMSGALKVCGTVTTDLDSVQVTGEVHVATGILSYSQAEQKAHAVADAPYVSRVDFKDQQSATGSNADGTYLSTGVSNWAYRSDGSDWLFIIHEIRAGGDEGAPGDFADTVLVRVSNAGSACVVKTTPHNGVGLGVDIFKDMVNCP